MLQRIWDQNPPPANAGDVNGDNAVNVIDVLTTARYYIGLNPAGFIARNADVDCSDGITIIDAFMVARYDVGIVCSFGC
ncbi:MAG: hypothetical protein JW881_20515 [Spirochaetales bacterium]|nr:hypothetical protein [Spirochaetales bacterium]